MLKSLWWFLLFWVIFMVTSAKPQNVSLGNDEPVNDEPLSVISEEQLAVLLSEYDSKSIDVCNRYMIADWNVDTDVGNKVKEEIQTKAVAEKAKFTMEWHSKYWKNANETDYKDESLRRQLHFHKNLGDAVLPPNELDQLTKTITQMKNVYNSAAVCPYMKQNCSDGERLTLDPDIERRFEKSRNYDELAYLWKQWRDDTGRKIRSKYADYVELMNKVATGNGFKDAGDYWKDEFEDPQFEQHVDELWKAVEPLYLELHTYMRYKLIAIYGDKINRKDEHIEAHLLGNMWAQTWTNLYQETKPFKNGSMIDVTEKLRELKYDVRKMFETSNEFYMSLGLPSNKMSYTGDSVIEKPTNRTIQCHASAFDFCNGKDFRIKMCTNLNQADLITIHHEMGHIQYYIQYKDQPLVLRKGANPGFHEAIGDVMALSVANPRHLVKIGLLNDYTTSHENNINALYMVALERVAFLPFGLLIDKWRWDVFSKKIDVGNWNEHWWELRKKYQKVVAPVDRVFDEDFDPGAKFHVPAGSKYISYFISHILEFSFYKALCIESGEYNVDNNKSVPLHQCVFYRSKAAGKKLADALKLGGSKHWSKTLKLITNETEISADAILEYFSPLRKVLVNEIERMKEEDEVRQKLAKFDEDSLGYSNKMILAKWDSITDLQSKSKEAAFAEAVTRNSHFTKEQYNVEFKKYANTGFVDEKLSRQIHLMGQLETMALDDNDLTNFTNIVSEMVKIYNEATICSYTNQNCSDSERLSLEPDIIKIMAKSRNQRELLYVWTQWHGTVGRKVKPLYLKYVELNNKAAKLNGYDNAGKMWLNRYEDTNFEEKLRHLYYKIKPLYDELHAYTKKRLWIFYGGNIVDPDRKHIPGHLFGNVWGQSWENLYDLLRPFKYVENADVTEALKEKNFTALKIFETANKFYESLGLESNEMSYTGKSIIEKPTDRLIDCHASAWDFYDGKDLRIKQCTTVNEENFITAHHEMGHIQYYIQYKDQPLVFRKGVDPGFHEAIGDVMALSVMNPSHLKKINLLDNFNDTIGENTNFLFKMALQRIAFIPYAYVLDMYRYELFSGMNFKDNCEWNTRYWKLRQEYQKIRWPEERESCYDFDAGTNFHVVDDYTYTADFVSHIVQFQIFRALCIAAQEYDPNNSTLKPLYKCDLQGSLVAGQRIRDALQLGKSVHWSIVLKVLTDGETEISADGILEYFAPIYEYLQKENNSYDSGFPTLAFLLAGIGIMIILLALVSYLIHWYNRL